MMMKFCVDMISYPYSKTPKNNEVFFSFQVCRSLSVVP